MIYFVLNTEVNAVKIGYTQQNPKERLANLQTGSSCYLVLIATIEGDTSVERQYHEQFKKYRKTGEWFFFGEEIKDFITDLHSNVLGDELSNVAQVEKKMSVSERLFEICKAENNKEELYKDARGKNFYIKKEDCFVDFDVCGFKYNIAEQYKLFPSTAQLINTLGTVSTKIIDRKVFAKNLMAIEFDSAFSEYIDDEYISKGKEFVLSDVLKELNLPPAKYSGVATNILKHKFKLSKPTSALRRNGERRRWWNVD